MTEQPTIDQADDISGDIQLLQDQIDAVSDQIGAVAIHWKRLASDPKAAMQGAERISVLERQRDMLTKAKADAEGARAKFHRDGKAEQAREQALIAQQAVINAIDRYEQNNAELAAVSDAMVRCIKARGDLRRDIVKLFDPGKPAHIASGITWEEAKQCIRGEDVHYVISQYLARSLGQRLWPEETCPASMYIDVGKRLSGEMPGLRGHLVRSIEAKYGPAQYSENPPDVAAAGDAH